MPLTLAVAATAGHVQAVMAPPPNFTTSTKASGGKAAAQSSAGSATGSAAQQQAALNRMLATYTRDQSHGIDAGTLSVLGKQILAAAKAIGQHVTLPQAPANTGAVSTAPVQNAASGLGKVDVVA